jgi:hypothetical protein
VFHIKLYRSNNPIYNSISNNLDELDGNFEGDGVEDLTILEEETHQVVIKMVDSMELHVISQTSSPNILPIVSYEGHTIYKSIFVSQLNGNHFLSKDRLTRDRNSINFNNADDYIAASSSTSSMMLGLGSDCGFFFTVQLTVIINYCCNSTYTSKAN